MSGEPTTTDPQIEPSWPYARCAWHPRYEDGCTDCHLASWKGLADKRAVQLDEQATQLREAREKAEYDAEHAATAYQRLADVEAERDETQERVESAELDAENLGRKLGEAQAQVAVLADLIPKALEGAHWNESCGPDYDDGCSCTLGTLAKTLANLPTAARDLLTERDALREFVEHVAGQPTVLIGNPYYGMARNALTPPQADIAPREE